MITKNRLIIVFTLFYLFIEIGFRALINDQLKAPVVSQEVTDLFATIGRLISSIGFTVILFNWLKNNPWVSEHPKKSIAGLYFTCFLFITIITSLALSWLPVNTQVRAFYGQFIKNRTYFEFIENESTNSVSEVKLTTIPLIALNSQYALSDIKSEIEPAIPTVLDSMIFNNQGYFLASLGRVENEYIPFWVLYNRASSFYDQNISGERLEQGILMVRMLYRKYARETFHNYRTDVLQSFYTAGSTTFFIDDKSSDLAQKEFWVTETYNTKGKVYWWNQVNYSPLMSTRHRRDDLDALHNISNSYKKKSHGFNSIDTSAEYYELMKRHRNFFESRLNFFGPNEMVDISLQQTIINDATARCKNFNLNALSQAQKQLIQTTKPISSVVTITEIDGKKKMSRVSIDDESLKDNITICDYRGLTETIRQLLLDKATRENRSRGFQRDINTLEEFKQTAHAKQEITAQLSKHFGISLKPLTAASNDYFAYVVKTVARHNIGKQISEQAASARFSCNKNCGKEIPLGLDRVSLMSLPIFREKIQPSFPFMYDADNRFISTSDSKSSRDESLKRLSQRQKRDVDNILQLISSGKVMKSDLAPYTRASLGPIILMVFANLAILLNIGTLLVACFKVKKNISIWLITLTLCFSPFVFELFSANSQFAMQSKFHTTRSWLLGANRMVSSVPLVESSAETVMKRLLLWYLTFDNEDIGKERLRGSLYKELHS